MGHNYSVLSKASRADLRWKPFPHLVVRDALPERHYRELEACYPSDELIVANDFHHAGALEAALPNERYQVSAAQVLEGGLVAPIWSDFVAFHTSADFYREFLDLFAGAIRATHPHLERRLERDLAECRVGVRRRDDDGSDLVLDCQLGINTAPVAPGRTLGPHLDNPVELFAGLLYVRRPGDESSGGDLEIQTWRSPRRSIRGKLRIDDALVETVETIAYEPNTFVLFLNSPESVHSVTPRSVTPLSRRLVNVIGEVYPSLPSGLFSREELRRSGLRRLLSRGRELLRGPGRATSS